MANDEGEVIKAAEETLLFPSDKIVHVDDLPYQLRRPGNFVYKRVFTPAQAVAEEEVPF